MAGVSGPAPPAANLEAVRSWLAGRAGGATAVHAEHLATVLRLGTREVLACLHVLAAGPDGGLVDAEGYYRPCPPKVVRGVAKRLKTEGWLHATEASAALLQTSEIAI